MATESTIDDSQTLCGECGKGIPHIKGHIPWCECGWNLEKSNNETSKGLIGDIYRSLGQKRGKAVFEKLLKSHKIPREVGLTTTLLIFFSAVVQLFVILSLALGVYFIFKGFSNLFLFIPGLGLLGLAWVGRPRFGSVPVDALAPEEFPELHRTVKRIAEALGTEPPDHIVVNEEFNAAVARAGFSQRKVLFIGLPLFLILSGQEKIALISHELAHFVKGDPTRGLFVSVTARTLSEWHQTLYPGRLMPGGEGSILAMAAEFLSNAFLYTISWIPYILLVIFAHLAWNRSQAAEYLADKLGAKVSGTDAFVSMNEKTFLEPKVSAVVQRVVLNDRSEGTVSEIQAEVRNIHPREFDRIKRIAELEEVRLNATHPPTAWRVRLLRAYQFQDPILTMSEDEDRALTEELSPLVNSVNQRLTEGYLRYICY